MVKTKKSKNIIRKSNIRNKKNNRKKARKTRNQRIFKNKKGGSKTNKKGKNPSENNLENIVKSLSNKYKWTPKDKTKCHQALEKLLSVKNNTKEIIELKTLLFNCLPVNATKHNLPIFMSAVKPIISSWTPRRIERENSSNLDETNNSSII